MQVINSMQDSTWSEQCDLLVDSMRTVIWTKVAHFLDGDYISFVWISEDRPDLALRRHVARVSVEMAKYYFFPHGLSLNPFNYGSLLLFSKRLLFLFASSFLIFSRPPHRCIQLLCGFGVRLIDGGTMCTQVEHEKYNIKYPI